MGLPGRYDDPDVVDAVRRTVEAARRQGKFVAMGGPGRDEHWALFIEIGVQMVLTENDLSLLMRGARERAAFFAGLVGK
jgi:2-keto-3-deoxy-L-rhamnonate aldolase RhmA